MSIKHQPESRFEFAPHQHPDKLRIGIAVAEWNQEITSSLLASCIDTLAANGINKENILVKWVPGSYELPLGAQWLIEYGNADAVACLGCIIKGETPHFQYISEAVALGINEVALKYNKVVGFGVITAEEEIHAKERAGGNKGNKGEEAAMAILKMLKMKADLKDSSSSPIGFR